MVHRLGHHAGGIRGLCQLVDEHGGALEYDLMTRAGATLSDVPARVPWTALRSFVTHLGPDSALHAEQNPDGAAWWQPWGQTAVLADIYDAIASFTTGYATANRGKGPKPKPPKPYPRPWKAADRGRRVGSGAIPASEFDDWWVSDGR